MEVVKSGFKWLWAAQFLTFFYFAYFLVILPILGIIEKPKPRPLSIADSVLGKHGQGSAGGTPVPGAANAAAPRDDA